MNNKISRIDELRLRLKDILELRHIEVSETDTLTDLINKIDKINYIQLAHLSLSIISSNVAYKDFFDCIDKSKVTSLDDFKITKNEQEWAVPLLENLRLINDISLERLNINTTLPLDLSNLTTGYITNFCGAFYGGSYIPKINLGSLKVKQGIKGVDTLKEMFCECTSLTEVHMENMIIEPDAYDLSKMFYNCTSLKSLDLSSFNFTIRGSFLNNFLYNCTSLEYLDISNLKVITEINNTAFKNVPNNCEIIVNSDEVVDFILAKFPNLTNVSCGDLVDFSVEEAIEINIAKTRTREIQVKYSGGKSSQRALRIQSDKATWNNATKELTLNNDVQEGDIFDIIFISEYNPELQHTMSVTVVNIVSPIEVDTQDGEFIETDPTDTYPTYMSDKGSYHINNGKSNAYIRFSGMKKAVFYIKSDAESSYDYIEAFNLDTSGTRGSGIVTTKGKQKQWIRCEYVIPDLGEHFIHIMYSKDGSVDSGADRGYFYVAEEECE